MASTINVLTTGVGGIQQTGDTSGILQMQTNGTATLTIDTSGNVGVGTINPASKLHVNTNGNTNTGGITLQNASNQQHFWYLSANTTSAFEIGSSAGTWTWTNSGGERLRIDSTGAIGLSGANYGTSGQFLTSNGPGAAASWTTAAGGFSNMTVFASPGTFTTPSTTTKIKVTVVGGGGGSGAGAPGSGGGGGGGGAIYVGPVSASTGYAVTVGSGGTYPGGSGGTSSFGALASATGGTGVATSNLTGGAGGAGSAGTLQFKGGGGNAGYNGNPALPVAYSYGGAGGNSIFGGGGAGTYSTSNAGGNYGGGASGSGPGAAAQNGGGGVVIVEY